MAYRDQHSPEARANKKKRQADYRDRKRRAAAGQQTELPPPPVPSRGPVGQMAHVLSAMPMGATASLKADFGAECIELARRIVQQYEPAKATPRDAVALAQLGFLYLEVGLSETNAQQAEAPRFTFSEDVLKDPEQRAEVFRLMRRRKPTP